MPTKKPRLNVVLEPGLYKALGRFARGQGVSLSLMARDLIKEALEIHEDRYWDRTACEREKTFSCKKALSHEELWEQ